MVKFHYTEVIFKYTVPIYFPSMDLHACVTWSPGAGLDSVCFLLESVSSVLSSGRCLATKRRRGVELLFIKSLPVSYWTPERKMSASKARSQTIKPGLKYRLSKWTEDELFGGFNREMSSKSFSAASEEEQREICQQAMLQPVIKLHRIGVCCFYVTLHFSFIFNRNHIYWNVLVLYRVTEYASFQHWR